MLPIVAFPRSVLCLALALVRQLDEQAPVPQPKVQVEIFPGCSNAHPPVVMVHLLQVDGSARGNYLIKSTPTILHRALGSDLELAAVLFPDEIVRFGIAHD